ncbi:MAG TPA: TlpA disulfide reductase family protein [Pyrinomonadaceae bacterium]|jgi:thiol-disulfide isomerase/thioredoxin
MSKKLALIFALAFAFSLTSAVIVRAQNAQQKTPTPAPAPTVAATTAPAQTGTMLTRTADGHEYAPILEKTLNYKDWTLKSLKDGSPVNLRQWAKGKKLVLVVYYAPWCGNWKMEAPVVARLYEKYKAHGFDVIAVNEYGSQEEAKAFFGAAGAPYTVVVESEGREAREQTAHYTYRQASGDPRRWGSPFNIFLEPATLKKTGDVLAEKALIVGGELIEKDAEQFIRQRLGLAAQASVEQCEQKTL